MEQLITILLQATWGKLILDSATIVASLIGMCWLGYMAWVKHCDTRLKIAQTEAETRVKVARESSTGAEALKKIEEANQQRDLIIKKLEHADQQALLQEEARRREAERHQDEVRQFKNQMELRIQQADQRLIQLLTEISNRNPYNKMMDNR